MLRECSQLLDRQHSVLHALAPRPSRTSTRALICITARDCRFAACEKSQNRFKGPLPPEGTALLWPTALTALCDLTALISSSHSITVRLPLPRSPTSVQAAPRAFEKYSYNDLCFNITTIISSTTANAYNAPYQQYSHRYRCDKESASIQLFQWLEVHTHLCTHTQPIATVSNMALSVSNVKALAMYIIVALIIILRLVKGIYSLHFADLFELLDKVGATAELGTSRID
eukprot:15438-Heterococcus_DN1.PRE.1